MAPQPNLPQHQVSDVLRAAQDRTLRATALLRFGGASAFLTLFLVLGTVLGQDGWRADLRLFSVYVALAFVVVVLGRRGSRWLQVLGLSLPLLDMPVVALLQLSTYPRSNPSGVAGFTVGIFVLLLILASLTLERWAIALTALSGIVLEGLLQHAAHVDPGAIGASAILLLVAAGACAFSRGQVADLVERMTAVLEARRVTEAALEETKALSLTDELTGLYNRRGFHVLAGKQMSLSDRTGLRHFLFFADLDGLKPINDKLGHAEGDRAIRDAAEVLRRTFREADVVARLGGDEFVAFLAETAKGSGPRILDRVAEQLAEFNAGEERPYALSMSVGLTLFDPAEPLSLEELLSKADAQMYAQKQKRPSSRGRERHEAAVGVTEGA